MPATLTQYQEFQKGLTHLANHSTDQVIKEKIIRALIGKVWIHESGFKLEFMTGGEYIEMQQRSLEPDLEIPESTEDDESSPPWDLEDVSPPDFRQKKSRAHYPDSGSNSLTNGGPTRIRYEPLY